MEQTRINRPFKSIAFCLLPEHLHCIWKLPEGDADFSKRWAGIKGYFSRQYLRQNPIKINFSRKQRGEVKIWQPRFWEHQIRAENDLQRHIDYIHYNPIKHGLVKNLEDWPFSTYHKYVKQGFYGKPNAFDNIKNLKDTQSFGE